MQLTIKKRVAAYCRVSTDKEDQLMSLKAQEQFFKEYAEKNNLELVEIYADEGISGTKLRNRKAFQRMMKDAERGRFEVLFVKDVSRLARNVVDFLQSIRKLKMLDIACNFITSNMSINDGELTLTIMAAVAQEESANLSKRVRFGKQKNAEQGRVPNLIYGYDKVKGSYFDLTVNKREAEVVQQVFKWYACRDYGANRIAQKLNESGIRTKRGCTWTQAGIRRLLSHRIYIGEIVNGQEQIKDYLTGQRIKKGCKDWIVTDNPSLAIVDQETFDRVQEIINSRTENFHKAGEVSRWDRKYLFSGLIKCSSCGSSFRRVTRLTKRGERITWVCQGRNANGRDFCPDSTVLLENDLIEAVRDYLGRFDADALLRKTMMEMKNRYSPSDMEHDTVQLEQQLRQLQRKRDKQIEMFEADVLTLQEFKERTSALKEQIADTEEKLEILQEGHDGDTMRQMMDQCCSDVQNMISSDTLDSVLIHRIIDKIQVTEKGEVTIELKMLSELVNDLRAGDKPLAQR